MHLTSNAILAEHPDFYVINKPSGIGMHTEESELGIIVQLQQLLAPNPSAAPLFPVHRLDKGTSGLLLVARNKGAATAFGALFSEHAIDKYYVAIAGHKPKKKQGLIQGDMAKSRNGGYKLLRSMENPARTHFFSHNIPAKNIAGMHARLYILKPSTGRTHQLRVALKSIGAAILGDTRYGGEPAERLMLHASALRFLWNGEPQCFVCLPEQSNDFVAIDWQQFPHIQSPWLYHWPK
ncbi:pseudouridine synthase [Aliidiomarina sp.]|uniref:pseudouridine synthase n=1 Tax=Aliidiomarina sp. TaxID=1872439 RepID=UPI003A4D618D